MSGKQPAVKMQTGLKFKTDWKQLYQSLSEAAVHGVAALLGKVDSVPSSLAALAQAFGAQSSEDEPGQKAWRLFWLSFAWSLDELKATESLDEDALRTSVREAMDAAKKLVDSGGQYVPISFLDNPTNLPIYRIVRDEFVNRRAVFRPGIAESAQDFSARFDSAFSRGVAEILVRNPDTFQSLIQALKISGASSGLFELQWMSYRRKLSYEFNVRPMFGQEDRKVSLGQAYIPLRCKWKEESENNGEIVQKFGDLDSVLNEWIDISCKSEDSVKLIGGGPGSGKSTSVKKFAFDLSQRPSFRPLYIPLQHISLDGSLRDAINSYFTNRTNGSFNQPPLAREAIENGPEIVLIFDGLDEIARPGEGADDIANLFITKLDQLQSSLKGDAPSEVKIIVTGRLPAFQAAKKFRGALGVSALEVVGYAPVRDVDPNDVTASMDQRPLWWSRYAPLAGFPLALPQALSDSRLADVTNEPLLCYLLVLSGFAVDQWEEAADNRNLIYERLIGEVWRRGWGEAEKKSDRQGPGRHLTQSQFNSLMETIALAAWLGGDTRVASDGSFHSALKIMRSENSWDEFKRDGGEDVTNLAMNFYLKASEESLRGFEFTHKSFGDYLTARALLAIALEAASLVERFPDLALQAWLNGTCTGVLTEEILGYVRDECRLITKREVSGYSKIEQLFKSIEQMAKIIIQEGLPAHNISGLNWRSVANYQKNSEVTLWGVLSSCAHSLQGSDEKVFIRVGFEENRLLFKTFISRVSIGDESASPILKCFCYLDAKNSDLFAIDLSRSDFRGSILSGANLNGTHLMHSNLTNCDLKGAKLQRSNLDHCSLGGSDITDVDLRDARIWNCDIFKETVGNVNISPRTILDYPIKKTIPVDRIIIEESGIGVYDKNFVTRAERAIELFKLHLTDEDHSAIVDD